MAEGSPTTYRGEVSETGDATFALDLQADDPELAEEESLEASVEVDDDDAALTARFGDHAQEFVATDESPALLDP